MKRRNLILAGLSVGFLAACRAVRPRGDKPPTADTSDDMPTDSASAVGEDETMGEKIVKTEDEWRAQLTPQQFNVLRSKGTEYAFSGEYWDHKEDGLYVCAGCGNPVFASETKYASGTGWPSFYAPISEDHIGTERDGALGMRRVEVHCSRCGGHLGHVFSDGPEPTGLRYCLNSVSLEFQPEE